MKTSHIVLKTFITAIFISFIVIGCKKNDETTPNNNSSNNNNNNDTTGQVQQTTRASNQTELENISTQALDDVNKTIDEISTAREVQTICGLTFDSSTTATTGIIDLYYNGTTPCNGYYRSGHIQVKLPTSGGQVVPFSTAGVTATLNFDDYKVTNQFTGKYVVFNGYEWVKNVNAGGWYALLFPGGAVTHKVKADLDVEYSDSTTAEWNAKIVRSVSNIGGTKVQVSLSADTLIQNLNIAYWGVNRLGENFRVEATPYTYDVYNTTNGNTCLYKPLTGDVNIRYGSSYGNTLTINYGIDQSTGNQAAAGVCPDGFNIKWTGNNGNQIGPVFVPY